jgi:hypothetical protein
MRVAPEIILTSEERAELRRAGWDSAEIAPVLGERCAETSRW